jgi:hypothetical protein
MFSGKATIKSFSLGADQLGEAIKSAARQKVKKPEIDFINIRHL